MCCSRSGHLKENCFLKDATCHNCGKPEDIRPACLNGLTNFKSGGSSNKYKSKPNKSKHRKLKSAQVKDNELSSSSESDSNSEFLD